MVRAIHASRIPVVSAIGHEIDITLSDLVADVRALTPSEAAELVAPASEELLARLRQTEQRLGATLRWRVKSARSRLDSLAQSRALRRPLDRIRELARRLDELEARASRAVGHRIEAARRQVDKAAAGLDSLSPLAVLGRGYSLTQRISDRQIVRDAAELSPGEQITTRFAHGEAVSRVERIDP